MEHHCTIRFSNIRIPRRGWRANRRTKSNCKRNSGLPAAANTPLFGTITRLAEQKGVDIQLGALEEMLARTSSSFCSAVVRAAFERAYLNLARRFPSQVAVRIGYDEGLSHRIEAGCDFYLMPSWFEPSGLNQMYSLRYGTIPVVRAVGGLDDSVIDCRQDARAPTELNSANLRSCPGQGHSQGAGALSGTRFTATLPPKCHEEGFFMETDRRRILESVRSGKKLQFRAGFANRQACSVKAAFEIN